MIQKNMVKPFTEKLPVFILKNIYNKKLNNSTAEILKKHDIFYVFWVIYLFHLVKILLSLFNIITISTT